jgi:hypothetical protein
MFYSWWRDQEMYNKKIFSKIKNLIPNNAEDRLWGKEIDLLHEKLVNGDVI